MPAEREVERKDKGKEGKMQNAKEEDNDKTEEGKTEAGKPNLLRKTKKSFCFYLLHLWLCQVRVNKLLLE